MIECPICHTRHQSLGSVDVEGKKRIMCGDCVEIVVQNKLSAQGLAEAVREIIAQRGRPVQKLETHKTAKIRIRG